MDLGLSKKANPFARGRVVQSDGGMIQYHAGSITSTRRLLLLPVRGSGELNLGDTHLGGPVRQLVMTQLVRQLHLVGVGPGGKGEGEGKGGRGGKW